MKMQTSENEIVGYVDGKAIVKDDSGRWFFIDIPEAFVTPGEQAFEEDLTPLEMLSPDEQKKIIREMGD